MKRKPTKPPPVAAGAAVCCRYCGRGGLAWRLQQNGKWRLYDRRGRVHVCRRYVPRDEGEG